MASRLCRETQTSLCIKNPANITAIRKQQQQYQYIPGSSLYERDFFIFSCYNTRYLGDQSKESEGIWGQLIFRKMYNFYSLYGFCLLLYTYIKICTQYRVYMLQTLHELSEFSFFSLSESFRRGYRENMYYTAAVFFRRRPPRNTASTKNFVSL